MFRLRPYSIACGAAQIPAPAAPPDCASYRSLRAIGRPKNSSAARACAWQERLAQKAELGQSQKQPIAWVVGGSLILAEIYFNGTGVRRNIPLALRFACESDKDMAEAAAIEIAKRNPATGAGRAFEFCDYAESTFMASFRTAYASEIMDDRRTRYFDSLKSSMPPKQLAAFEKLLSTEAAYIDSHSLEVDQGGTIRAVRNIRSQDILNDLFRAEIVHFERGKWPVFSDKQIASADTVLEHEYERTLQRLRSHAKNGVDQGDVTAITFRAWKGPGSSTATPGSHCTSPLSCRRPGHPCSHRARPMSFVGDHRVNRPRIN